MYEAKKTLGALGMNFEKIHTCSNDCCLYRKEYANAIECPECGESRWKYANNVNKGKSRFLEKLYDTFHRFHISKDCFEVLTMLKI